MTFKVNLRLRKKTDESNFFRNKAENLSSALLTTGGGSSSPAASEPIYPDPGKVLLHQRLPPKSHSDGKLNVLITAELL